MEHFRHLLGTQEGRLCAFCYTFTNFAFAGRSVVPRMGPTLFIEQICLFNVSEQIWWNKVVEVIYICFSCSMLCMDGLLLHLVGKKQLFVYPWASCGNSKLGAQSEKVIIKVAGRANNPILPMQNKKTYKFL